MFEAFLVTTSSEGLQPLGSAAQRSFELVTSTVRARLGPEHAALFAEPVATEHGDQIDWYAPMAGTAVPLPELPEAEQEALRARLGRLVADITELASSLADSPGADDQRLSEALLNAVEIPGEAMVHAVRGADGGVQPVLVHWAWLREERRAVRGVLTKMVPRPAPALVAAAPALPLAARLAPLWRALFLLGWLLLAVLLGAILYLMIYPCGLAPGRLTYCPAPAPPLAAAFAETQVVQDEVAILERELALTDRACRPMIPVLPATQTPQPEAPVAPPAAPAPEPQKTEAPSAEAERRVTERGGLRGDLNFVLEWNTTDDIDLYVTCPGGETISYQNRTACGGNYDLDANVMRRSAMTDPVENIVFEDAELGIYKVRVHLRSDRTGGEKPVKLHVLRRNGPTNSYTGTVAAGRSEWTKTISISR